MRRILATGTLTALVLVMAWLVQAPTESVAGSCVCTSYDMDTSIARCDSYCDAIGEGTPCIFIRYENVYVDGVCVQRNMHFQCNMIPNPVSYTYRCTGRSGPGGGGGSSSPIFKKDVEFDEWWLP